MYKKPNIYEVNNFKKENQPQNKNGLLKFVIIMIFIVVFLVIAFVLLERHTIKTVYVEGNLHYSEEEIKGIVMEGMLGNNSLYLSFKYKNKGIKNIPFIDIMDVNIISPDTIKITVFEKSLAGYVEFMDKNMYFDKDGYVIESSSVKTVGIPQITGLSFDYIILGEQLPIEDENIFSSIMDITKLLSKYELTADKIYFDTSQNISIYFGDIKASLGSSDYLEDKLMILPQFLEKLEGKKGVLRMENYKEDTSLINFEATD